LKPLIDEVGGIEKIKAMGIGAPNGNYYSGCIEDAPNLEWRGNIPLVKMFQEALGIPVVLTNDANAAAIGEMAYGAARGMKNFIEITLGTGVGSGVVVNGQLVYGHDGFAGELGHVIVEKNGRECGCGRRGCLECYCSGTGIARSAIEKLAVSRRPSSLRDILSSKLEAKDVSIAASNGDELALEILADTGRRLGEACANFAPFSSPEAFIFFGGPTKAGELLMAHVRKAYDENVLFVYKGKAKILLSELDGASAAVLGASALGWEM
jgi:glucokinase